MAGKRQKSGLTDFQETFALEYMIDRCGGPAYRRAGGEAKEPYTAACGLLGNPRVAARIQELSNEKAEELGITASNVIERYWQIATTDTNELVQHRRRACRYCYGIDHRYQWFDDEEWQEACRKAEDADPPRKPPSNNGGYGYQRKADPIEDCPRCEGEGEGVVHVADSRRASPGAKALYAGAKQTKDGVEIKTHDRLAALEKVAKHLGMLDTQKVSLDIEEGSPLAALIGRVAGSTLKPGHEVGSEDEDA